jgi:hypothetical protein
MPSIRPLLALAFLLAWLSAASAEPAFEIHTICRTAIAAMMDRDPKLVQATDASDGTVVLTYARPFDNFVYTYRCRIDGDRVIWADEPGRWRDGPKDAKVSFEVVSSGERIRIVITRANGITGQQLFDHGLNEVH